MSMTLKQLMFGALAKIQKKAGKSKSAKNAIMTPVTVLTVNRKLGTVT
jgi:hypothetical protein